MSIISILKFAENIRLSVCFCLCCVGLNCQRTATSRHFATFVCTTGICYKTSQVAWNILVRDAGEQWHATVENVSCFGLFPIQNSIKPFEFSVNVILIYFN